MRERDFIRQNRAQWQAFEALFSGKTRSPRRLTELYVRIIGDLAYARTFYPNRSVRVYLNHLAQRVTQRLHAGRPRSLRGMARFWTEDLPQVLHASRTDLLLSLLVFLGAVGIGLVSSLHDDTFAQLILGGRYVDMTEANIASGDPMAVYKDSAPFPMFVRIALNNLFVDVLCFAAGALFMVGTLFVLLINGIMVGTFQYFFVEYGLFRESFLTIWQHGTLEMSAAVLAGGAGLAMGRGVAFPGTYTRGQAFRLSARRAVRIMALVVPMTVLAAAIESWVTRLTEIPDGLRALGILASLAFVLGYAVWYPRVRARSGWSRPLEAERLPAPRPPDLDLGRTRSAGELFALGWVAYGRNAWPWARGVLAACAALGGLAAAFPDFLLERGLLVHTTTTANGPLAFFAQLPRFLRLTAQFGDAAQYPFTAPVHVIGLFAATVLALRAFSRFPGAPQAPAGTAFARHARVLALTLPTAALLFLPGAWGRLAFAVAFPWYVMAAAAAWTEGRSAAGGWSRAAGLIAAGPGTVLGAYATTGLLCFVALWLVHSPLMGLWLQAVETSAPFGEDGAMRFRVGYAVFMALSAFFLLLPAAVHALVGAYFQAREATEAHGLRREWARFGERQRRWG